jgi:hypothetical protein
MKRIPIKVAKQIAKEHCMKQVIVVAWDGDKTHVVTYGMCAEDCDQAAQGGDFVKKALGWPNSLSIMPSRVKALQKRVDELELELSTVREG